MNEHKYIADKTERKLLEQTQEFNILRDRSLVVSGFGIAMVTAYFTLWNNQIFPYNHILIVTAFIALIGIGIMIYGVFTKPLSRGMNALIIKEILEEGKDFHLSEIAYNLESFNNNLPLLKKLQFRLNLGVIIQTTSVIIGALCIYFNQISNG